MSLAAFFWIVALVALGALFVFKSRADRESSSSEADIEPPESLPGHGPSGQHSNQSCDAHAATTDCSTGDGGA